MSRKLSVSLIATLLLLSSTADAKVLTQARMMQIGFIPAVMATSTLWEISKPQQLLYQIPVIGPHLKKSLETLNPVTLQAFSLIAGFMYLNQKINQLDSLGKKSE